MIYIYEISANGNTYKLKLASRWAAEAEKKLGKPLLEAMDDMHSVETCAVFIWAALQKFHHSMGMIEAYDLMDSLIDEGKFSIEQRIDLITKILETGGFFTENQIQDMEQKLQELKNPMNEA